jgi:hypothetical protein
MNGIGNWKMVDACFDLPLKGPQKIILMAICRHYPKSFPSLSTIAREAGVHESTVKRSLPKLEQAGYLRRHRRPNKSTEYELAVGRITGGRIESPGVGAQRAQRTEPQGAECALGGRTEHPLEGAERATKRQLKEQVKEGKDPKQAAAIIQSLPANEVSPEKEMFHFMEDDKGEPCVVFDPFNLMPATNGSFPSTNPSLPAAVEVQTPPPPPPPVAPSLHQAARKPRFMVKPFYNHPGNWVIADTVLRGLVEETDDRRPKTFTDEAAAQTEAQELEMAAA